MGDIEQVKGYERLSNYAKDFFKMMYDKHMKVCGKELKAKWILAKVTEHRNYLKVYMHNGDWFHYYADGTWGVKTMGIGNEIRILLRSAEYEESIGICKRSFRKDSNAGKTSRATYSL